LSRFLECPHRYLLERVLGFVEPPQLAGEGTIDALSYGSLFHETAERFYRTHGHAFCAHELTLDEWKRRANEVADARFEQFLETYPLVGEEIRGAARGRLRRDLRALLATDWDDPKTFIDVERGFGSMPLTIGARVVHVRGFIDRIDTQGSITLVRDLKTGRAKRRKATEMTPAYDVQLGLYGLVLQAKHAEWNLEPTVQGAYVYPADPSGDERSFRDDFGDLVIATKAWISTGFDLMDARRFPRTPDEDDCTFCPFKPVCGPGAAKRAAVLLVDAPGMETFATLKLGAADEE
jgi:ATP-dependent helicase/DNAse subunit B